MCFFLTKHSTMSSKASYTTFRLSCPLNYHYADEEEEELQREYEMKCMENYPYTDDDDDFSGGDEDDYCLEYDVKNGTARPLFGYMRRRTTRPKPPIKKKQSSTVSNGGKKNTKSKSD